MTEDEIISIYKQIEDLSPTEIQNRVDSEFPKSSEERNISISKIGVIGTIATAAAAGVMPGAVAMSGAMGPGTQIGSILKSDDNDKPSQEKEELEKACRKSWYKNINKIHTLIQNNPKTSKVIMDIVVLLAPAIAQQYAGLSGMAIVGTLTIICKQNIGL